MDQRKKILERKKINKKPSFSFSPILKRISRIAIGEFQWIRNEFWFTALEWFFSENLVKYIKYNNLRSSRVFCPKFSLVLRCLSTHFGKWRHDRDSACRSLLLNCLQPSCTFLLDLFPVCFFSSLCGLMPGDSAWKILQTSDPAFPQRPRTFIYATITISLSQQTLLKDKRAQRQQWKPRCRAIITRLNHQGN